MSAWLSRARNRAAVYAVAVAAVALLGVYGVVKGDQGTAILSVIAALLGIAGPVTALGHITPDDEADQ